MAMFFLSRTVHIRLSSPGSDILSSDIDIRTSFGFPHTNSIHSAFGFPLWLIIVPLYHLLVFSGSNILTCTHASSTSFLNTWLWRSFACAHLEPVISFALI
jgi:hypothetical protein